MIPLPIRPEFFAERSKLSLDFSTARNVPIGAFIVAVIATTVQSQTIEDLRFKLTEAIAACRDGFSGTARVCEGSCEKALDKIANVQSLNGIGIGQKLSIGNCARILEKADSPQPAFQPIIAYYTTGQLPLGAVVKKDPTPAVTPAVAPAKSETLCGLENDQISKRLDGDWLMRQSEGVVMSGEMRLPSIAYPKGNEAEVSISESSRFTFNTLSYSMSRIDGMDDLFKDRDDMKEWLPKALEKAPLAQTSNCDQDWPMFRVYGKASSGYHSEIDIRLIAYSSTCMVGVHSGINAQFNGDPMPSAIYGFVLYKGQIGCD